MGGVVASGSGVGAAGCPRRNFVGLNVGVVGFIRFLFLATTVT